MKISRSWLVVAVLLLCPTLSARGGGPADSASTTPPNGDYTLLISDTSGAPVHHAVSPRSRQLLLDAHRALHVIERAQADVRRLERQARSLSADERRCTEHAAQRAAALTANARDAYTGVRRQMVDGRFTAARNHFAVISVLRAHAEAQRARAPECLALRYRHRGRVRVTVKEGAHSPAPRRAFWDRRDASHRNVIK